MQSRCEGKNIYHYNQVTVTSNIDIPKLGSRAKEMFTLKAAADAIAVAKSLIEVYNWAVKPLIEGTTHAEKSIKIDCKNNIAISSSYISADSPRKVLLNLNKKRFDINKVSKLNVYCMHPFPCRIDDAVSIDNNTWILNSNKIFDFLTPTGEKVETFRIEAQCHLEAGFIHSLARGDSSPEPLDNPTKYHLTAGLIDPSKILDLYKAGCEIDDLPVVANVQIQNEIKLNKYIQTVLYATSKKRNVLDKTQNDVTKSRMYNPHDIRWKFQQQEEEVRMRKLFDSTKYEKKIQGILTFLASKELYQYIHHTYNQGQKQNIFRMQGIKPNADMWTIAGYRIPKIMDVTSATNLSITKPAAYSELVYEQESIIQKFESILEK